MAISCLVEYPEDTAMNASTASLRQSDRIRWDIKGEALG